jgi:tetratricopeptide (TPR) repeat protein
MTSSSPAISEALQGATAAAEAGRFADAEAQCAQILAANPQDAGALSLAGALAARRGDLAGAVARYRAALAVAPGFVKALSNLGAALSSLGQLAEAERHLARALEEDPDHGASLINLGQLHLAQGRADAAIALLLRAVEILPGDAMAWNNLGAAYLGAERYADAPVPLCRALELDPGSAAAWSNLGNAHDRAGRYGEAADAFRAALANGAGSECWTHLGTALRGMGRNADALAAHDQALAAKPDLAEARFHRALILLAEGRFAEGWAAYRDRASGRAFRARQKIADTPRLPADMTGRRVLLLSNQGFGDELFFLRFVPALKRRGATVVYRAAAKLAPLVRQLPELDGVIDDDRDLPAADVTLLVDDLPYALDATDTPPALRLSPDAQIQAALRARLAALGPPPYLGVTWRGGVDKAGSLFKRAPLAGVARIAGAWPGTVVMLQRQPQPGECDAFVAEAGRAAHDLTALNDDLGGMLALLSLLDDYVAVSNTNVHLRQSLGLPSRVLLPMPADWRWMAPREGFSGDESPWFPGCPLYRQAPGAARQTNDGAARQTNGGAWDEAFARLSADLISVFSRQAP